MRKTIYRIFAIALALAMLAGSAYAANFHPYDAQEGKMLALQTLVDTCMWTASEDESYNTLTRWEEDIRVYINGSATTEDLVFYEEFIMQLSFRVPLMPRIERVYDQSEADLVINYLPKAELMYAVPDIYGESDIAFWHEQADSVFYNGVIALSTELTQAERNYGLLWCMVQLLGANNDGCAYEDSVLYSEWNNVQKLSEIDWLILNMIYSPWVEAGMGGSEVYQRIYKQIF